MESSLSSSPSDVSSSDRSEKRDKHVEDNERLPKTRDFLAQTRGRIAQHKFAVVDDGCEFCKAKGQRQRWLRDRTHPVDRCQAYFATRAVQNCPVGEIGDAFEIQVAASVAFRDAAAAAGEPALKKSSHVVRCGEA